MPRRPTLGSTACGCVLLIFFAALAFVCALRYAGY